MPKEGDPKNPQKGIRGGGDEIGKQQKPPRGDHHPDFFTPLPDGTSLGGEFKTPLKSDEVRGIDYFDVVGSDGKELQLTFYDLDRIRDLRGQNHFRLYRHSVKGEEGTIWGSTKEGEEEFRVSKPTKELSTVILLDFDLDKIRQRKSSGRELIDMLEKLTQGGNYAFDPETNRWGIMPGVLEKLERMRVKTGRMRKKEVVRRLGRGNPLPKLLDIPSSVFYSPGDEAFSGKITGTARGYPLDLDEFHIIMQSIAKERRIARKWVLGLTKRQREGALSMVVEYIQDNATEVNPEELRTQGKITDIETISSKPSKAADREGQIQKIEDRYMGEVTNPEDILDLPPETQTAILIGWATRIRAEKYYKTEQEILDSWRRNKPPASKRRK